MSSSNEVSGSALFQIIEFHALHRTQPSTKRPKFLQQPMSNCYNGYIINNNNNKSFRLEIYKIPGLGNNVWKYSKNTLKKKILTFEAVLPIQILDCGSRYLKKNYILDLHPVLNIRLDRISSCLIFRVVNLATIKFFR